jgi:hypothetical protein
MFGGMANPEGCLVGAIRRGGSLTGALGVAAGAELWAMGIESISRRKFVISMVAHHRSRELQYRLERCLPTVLPNA